MVSVADLVAEPELRLRPVGLPRPAAAVRWVASSELADPAPFLEGGEVLLTTGLDARGRTAAAWDGYVRRLVAAGVVAVGFGVGLSHQTVPAELTEACRRHTLNLVEVPRPTRFVAISRFIAHRVGEPGQAAAREALVMQRDLTMAALRGDGIAPVVARLADIVGGAACVVTADGDHAVGPRGTAAELAPAQLRPVVARLRPQGLRASLTAAGPDGVTVVQPVGLRGRPRHYLAVRAPELTEGQRSAITTAVALLGLATERGTLRRDVDRRLRRLAVELLVDADPRAAAGVLAAATGTVTTATTADAVTASLPDPLRVVRAAGPPDALDDGLWWLEETHPAVLAARMGDELWLVAGPDAAVAGARRLGERGLSVGVGMAAGLAAAGRSAATAAQALTHATGTRARAAEARDHATEAPARVAARAGTVGAPAAPGPVVRWDDMVATGAAGLIEPGAGAAFGAAFLDRIAAAPSGRAVLVATLEAFLRHHGQRAAVAAELGVHRNTVRNRLREVEAALGRSLDDPDVRVDAWLALRLTSGDAPPR